jgi:multidrug efflux pump subunit AcrB
LNAIVRIALQRPYTFIVMAMVIVIFGVIAAVSAPTDIFPAIKIPVIGVGFSYGGLPPAEMAGRIVTPFERNLTTTVDDIEHIESQSLQGAGTIKIFFQPNVDIRTATAQITAIAQSSTRQMPTGTSPPFILNYSASTVPILQLAMQGKGQTEQKMFDTQQNVVRPKLVSVQGAAMPQPYGGRSRNVEVDIDPVALQSKGLTPSDVQNAIGAQQQILPSGLVKIGGLQYSVKLNNAAESIEELNDLPIKTVNGGTVYLREIGHVRDGSSPQVNVVHVDGQRSVLTTILKNGSASTLKVVQGIKDRLPGVSELLPDGLKVVPLNDQSVFVKGAISGVVREGVIAAALTSLMILLFLGSWRSTVIIATSIPLAVLAAVAGLWATGQTMNIMTLGGLALAVGILVDDATVTIENINWHLEQGKDVRSAILDGAQQIVAPAFVALLCICISFVPMFMLKGLAGYLFAPMAEAVMFAMIASFVLSRTLVPTLAMYLLKPHSAEQLAYEHAAQHGGGTRATGSPLVEFQRSFETGFNKVRESYKGLLDLALARRGVFVVGFLICIFASFGLTPFLGSDFFPQVDSGQIVIHMRAPVGTRLEESSVMFSDVEEHLRQIIPAKELVTIVDNIGINGSPINLVYSNSGAVGPQDGDISIQLTKKHRPTADYVKKLREDLPRTFPGSTFSFLPADIVSQILNFGVPAPIDVQISGPNDTANRAYANLLMAKIRAISGTADVRIQQPNNAPQLRIDIDRTRVAQLGLTERDVTNNVLTSLAGTGTVAPLYFLNPQNNVSYSIVTQTPEFAMTSMSDLQNIPVSGGPGTASQVLGALGAIRRTQTQAVVSHYDVQPVIDVFATTQGRDLGAVAKDINKVLKDTASQRPKGATINFRGQSVIMNAAFQGLFLGLAAAIVLIYLLIVVNFQSWLDPFVIITALPAALAGIVWILFTTGTTLSVPALTGAIMCMGVATANSILVISFARERFAVTGDAFLAAAEAGFVRFRPVLMTALAMIIGMMPMALAMGEGGEQNAPLGRAVIGGLIFATIATLLFVPVVFTYVHGRKKTSPESPPAAESRPVVGEAYA